jgi:hypothetical protein
MATSVNVFGTVGFELEIDSHIKTRLIFAVADDKLKRLAWYFYSQSMGREKYETAWQAEFEKADMGQRKFDPKTDGGVLFGVLDKSLKTGFPSTLPTVNIASLADPLKDGFTAGFGPGVGLSPIDDDPQGGRMICELEFVTPDARQLINIRFQLATVAERRGFNVKKWGYLWLLKVEPFSLAAVKRGIRGAPDVDGHVDPNLAIW